MASSPEVLELLAPSDTRLNTLSRELSPEELIGDYVSTVTKNMRAVALNERDKDNLNRATLVGLAAPQLGAFVRIILFDKVAEPAKPNFEPELQYLINPRITTASSEQELGREGCYSTGAVKAAVFRSKSITVSALSLEGEAVTYQLEGFQARIVQHEIDHLNGVRCPDRVTSPEHLHDVKPEEFADYRLHWQDWPRHYPIERWLQTKSGIVLNEAIDV